MWRVGSIYSGASWVWACCCCDCLRCRIRFDSSRRGLPVPSAEGGDWGARGPFHVLASLPHLSCTPAKRVGLFPSPGCRLLWGRGWLVLEKGRILVIWGGPVCRGFLRILPSPCNIQFLPCVCGQCWAEAPAPPQQKETCACYQCRVSARKVLYPFPWNRICSSPLPPAAVSACTQEGSARGLMPVPQHVSVISCLLRGLSTLLTWCQTGSCGVRPGKGGQQGRLQCHKIRVDKCAPVSKDLCLCVYTGTLVIAALRIFMPLAYSLPTTNVNNLNHKTWKAKVSFVSEVFLEGHCCVHSE